MSDQIKYLHTKGPISESILVTGAFIRTIASTNPRFASVLEYLKSTPENELDAAKLLKLIDAGPEALKGIQKLSERVRFNGTHLFFDGDLLDNAISNHIARMIKGGDDHYHAFVAFLENLANNPSKKARRQLFTWIQDRKFTITEDGRFLAYKGVKGADNHSVHQGKATVNGEEIVGYIPNPIGAIVEMPRSNVDDDTHTACSTGLHAGTEGYARSYGDKLLLVAINPRDVVSVPKDAGFQKLRVCRYEVLDNANGQIEDTTYTGRRRWEGTAVVEIDEDGDVEVTLCLECGDETDGDQFCDEECEAYANGEHESQQDTDDELEIDSLVPDVDDKPEDANQCESCGEFLPEFEEGLCDDCDEDLNGNMGLVVSLEDGPLGVVFRWLFGTGKS
jgi:hypothetical protein